VNELLRPAEELKGPIELPLLECVGPRVRRRARSCSVVISLGLSDTRRDAADA